jgi:predicted AAA+ superfamily ATPase
MNNFLDQWKPYMEASDFQKLYAYLERANNNLPNDTILLIIGPARSGKSTLFNQIVEFIGESNIMNMLDF